MGISNRKVRKGRQLENILKNEGYLGRDYTREKVYTQLDASVKDYGIRGKSA